MKIFITGTDTDIGKTHATVSLMKHLNQKGLKTLGLKPLATGSFVNQNGELVNSDALKLCEVSTVKLPYQLVNPLCFKPPIAPHIAAIMQGLSLSSARIIDAINITSDADILLIEGAGGLMVPLNDYECYLDAIRRLSLPIIVVIGIKLGALNHAILCNMALRQISLKNLGWIANGLIEDRLLISHQIDYLQKNLDSPMIGEIEYNSDQIRLTKVGEQLFNEITPVE